MAAIASKDYQLAQALKAELEAAFPTRTVELVADPRVNRQDLTPELIIRVRPASWSQEQATRAYDTDVREVHVGIVAPCDPTDLAAIDAALVLCDQVRALWGRNGALRTKQIADHQPIGQLKQVPIFDEQTLLSSELFVGNITVKYATQT